MESLSTCKFCKEKFTLHEIYRHLINAHFKEMEEIALRKGGKI